MAGTLSPRAQRIAEWLFGGVLAFMVAQAALSVWAWRQW